MMAKSRAARRWAVSTDSTLPPRPRLGSRRSSRIQARTSEVRASACLGAGARLRHPLMASATTGWRAGLSAFCMPAAAWNGRRQHGPAQWWPWTCRPLPDGPSRGPRPVGWRAVSGGRRCRPIPGSTARRRRSPGVCCRRWRPGVRRRRPRPPRGRDRTVPGSLGAAGQRLVQWSRGLKLKPR